MLLLLLSAAELCHTRVHDDGANITETAIMYDLWPYPKLDDSLVDTQDECPGTLVRQAAAAAWDGRMRRRLRVLDAGTGTGQDCLALTTELIELEELGAVDDFSVTCMDISLTALGVARTRLAMHAVPAARMPTFLHGSFADTALLGTLGRFDFIVAEGSMHHNDDPAATLRLLASLLRDRSSVLRGFVYWEPGSRAITDVARAFRLLQDARGKTTTQQRLAPAELSRLRAYLGTLPSTSWYRLAQRHEVVRHDLAGMSNTALADLFLHPIEHQVKARRAYRRSMEPRLHGAARMRALTRHGATAAAL